jgi:2-hydroxy-3-keto-5-methylthiopentenyl-1-phosphate phosphatase
MLGSVYVDFDGTIAPTDPTDRLFERFGAPTWRARDCQRQQGRRPARECMAQQVDGLRATPEAIVELLSTIEIDRQFPAFVDLCRAWDLAVIVVSDGLDRVVAHVLRAAGLQLPFLPTGCSGWVTWGDGGWSRQGHSEVLTWPLQWFGQEGTPWRGAR